MHIIPIDKRIFKIEKGIYSDGENNFTTIEIVLKKYNHSFLVKDSALHLIGFVEKEPAKIHIGSARGALRIKDNRIQQHFYSNLDISILSESKWHQHSHFLNCENIKAYTTENDNEIPLFNFKALFFDLIRNYKDYPKSTLYALLEKFKNCRHFHDSTEWDLEENLQHDNIVAYIEFLDNDLYEKLEDIFSEIREREFRIEFDLDD